MRKYILYLAILVCFAIGIIVAYNLGANRNKKTQQEVKQSVYVSTYNIPTLAPTLTILPTPPPSAGDKAWEEMKREFGGKRNFVQPELSISDTYQKNTIVRFKNDLVVEFISNIHQIQPYHPNPREAYIVDISLVNMEISKSQYISYDDFELQDDRGYTYQPYTSYKGKGDITGELKPSEVKRGEICFITPLENINLVNYSPVFADKVKYIFKVKTRDQIIKFKVSNEINN